jgi:hypothetical protein
VKKDFINLRFINSLRRIGYRGFQFSEGDCTEKEFEIIDKIASSMEISFHHDNRSTNLCLHSRKVLERAKNSVCKALRMNASYIIFHPGRYPIKKYTQAKKNFLNNLLFLLNYCDRRRISLTIENNWENLIYDKSGLKIAEYRGKKEIGIMGSKIEFFDFLFDKIGSRLKITFDFSHLILQGRIESIKNKIESEEFSLGDENYVAYLASKDLIDSAKRYVDDFLKKFHPYIFATNVNETDFRDDVNFIPGDGIGLSSYVISELKKGMAMLGVM